SFIMSSGHELARDIAQLTEICVQNGDTNALIPYVNWIKSTDAEKQEDYAVAAFEPLWRNPDNAAVSAASEWLFNDPASPWSKLPWERSHFHDPLDSDLVKLPAFRKLLARELENQSIVGSMQWHRGRGINVSYVLTEPRSSGSYQFNWPDGDGPAD